LYQQKIFALFACGKAPRVHELGQPALVVEYSNPGSPAGALPQNDVFTLRESEVSV